MFDHMGDCSSPRPTAYCGGGHHQTDLPYGAVMFTRGMEKPRYLLYGHLAQ